MVYPKVTPAHWLICGLCAGQNVVIGGGRGRHCMWCADCGSIHLGAYEDKWLAPGTHDAAWRERIKWMDALASAGMDSTGAEPFGSGPTKCLDLAKLDDEVLRVLRTKSGEPMP